VQTDHRDRRIGLKRRPRSRASRIVVFRLGLLGAGVLFAVLALEGLLRLAVYHTGPQRLANPAAYADPLCDDDYWLLMDRAAGWDGPRHSHPAGEWDPQLGWTIDEANRDESGAWVHPPPLVDDVRPTLPLFGDSAMFGTTTDPERIAAYLQEQRPSRRVMNFAVGGYGLDQIVLSVERSLPTLDAPDTFVGVLTTDLDRAILKVRSGPKPYFEVEQGDLVMNRDHLAHGPEDFFRRHPPRFVSFVFARTSLAFRRQIAAHKGNELSCKEEEKSEITRLLIARLAAACRGHGCQVVLFQRQEELDIEPGWRERALREACEMAALPLVDTRGSFLALDPEQRYRMDRHPSAEANRQIALQLASSLSDP
jgi:hypothetical protein